MVNLLQWLLAFLGILCISYAIFLFVNTELQKREYEKRSFPCTYISGICTVKPTWKNCKHLGSIPIYMCERKLNR